MEFQALPEGCIATILSRTTPVDVCRLSLVSKIFRSAAESDAVWDRFLPSDSHFISSIISQSPLLASAPSKTALYLALSDHPLIIDQGKQSFQLDRKSGKKCYMLAARALSIVWGDDERYWNWITMSDSRDIIVAGSNPTIIEGIKSYLHFSSNSMDVGRLQYFHGLEIASQVKFPEVAELREVCWLEIRGVINTLALSPNTQYAAYLVFKMIDAKGFDGRPVELSVGNVYGQGSTKNVCLDPNMEGGPNDRVVGLQRPSVRSDGWLEVKMGKFFNSGPEDEKVRMSVVQLSGNWKMGLFLEGMEVRPKEDN